MLLVRNLDYATSIRCSGSGEDGNAIFRTGVEPTEREANDLDEAIKPKVKSPLTPAPSLVYQNRRLRGCPDWTHAGVDPVESASGLCLANEYQRVSRMERPENA